MDGILPFIKPPGITSHDAVGIVRRVLKEKRVGHSGTLDPMAMGVLPIYVGKATRFIEYNEEARKTYIGEGQFGIETDTEDLTGKILQREIWEERQPITFHAFHSICQTFLGSVRQRPSIYSAIKINGVRAYELARKGESVIIPEREIYIYNIEVLAYEYPFFTIMVECSGGTYMRALIRDICKKLDTIGTMTSLVRTKVGPFLLSDSYRTEELEEESEHLLLPIDKGLGHLRKVCLTQLEGNSIWQGKRLILSTLSSKSNRKLQNGLYCIYVDNIFFGIGEIERGILKGKKLIGPLK